MTLKLTDLAAVLLAVAVVVSGGGSGGTPAGPTIPEPSADAKPAVAPVTRLLSGHPDEARQLAAFYHDAADVLRRDGAGAKVVKTTAHFRTFCQRAVTLRFQGAFNKVGGLSDAIHGPDGALARLLKLDAAELDPVKAADALDAVAWACQEAAR